MLLRFRIPTASPAPVQEREATFTRGEVLARHFAGLLAQRAPTRTPPLMMAFLDGFLNRFLERMTPAIQRGFAPARGLDGRVTWDNLMWLCAQPKDGR